MKLRFIAIPSLIKFIMHFITVEVVEDHLPRFLSSMYFAEPIEQYFSERSTKKKARRPRDTMKAHGSGANGKASIISKLIGKGGYFENKAEMARVAEMRKQQVSRDVVKEKATTATVENKTKK